METEVNGLLTYDRYLLASLCRDQACLALLVDALKTVPRSPQAPNGVLPKILTPGAGGGTQVHSGNKLAISSCVTGSHSFMIDGCPRGITFSGPSTLKIETALCQGA